MDTLINALNDCLEKIQSGATIDQVVASYPELEDELRSLLETAHAAKSLRFEQTIPVPALVRSRSKYLNQAEKMVNARRNPHWGNSFRSSAALVYIVIICLVLALGTGIVSAQSIPGDIFYPVKLAGEQTLLSLENNPATRLSLEENYDRVRAQETDNLIQRERLIETTFAGFLTRQERDQWTVAGIRVVFPQNLQNQVQDMRGKYIEVTGLPQSSGLFTVEEVHLRQFEITGTIDAIQSDHWTVSQMSLGVSTETQIMGQPFIGGDAKLTVIRMEDNQLQAVSIQALTARHVDGQPTATQTAPAAPHVLLPTLAVSLPKGTSSSSNNTSSSENGAPSNDAPSNNPTSSAQKTPIPTLKENWAAPSPTETHQPKQQNQENDQVSNQTQVKSVNPGANVTPTKENTRRPDEADQNPRPSPTQQNNEPGHTPSPDNPPDSGHH